MRVLIVEDERRLAQALKYILEEAHYIVDLAYDGEDGWDYARIGQYDVVVLDVMLPKRTGFEIVSHMRKNNISSPVLMLTAKDELSDKVQGLDAGADDYMTKPFAPEELLARIRALSRRTGEVVHEQMGFGDITLDLSSNTLHCGQKQVRLGFKELEVLRLLMARKGAIISKEDLIVRVWGNCSNAEDNNAEAHVSFLRKKLHYLHSKTEIETIRKIGYRLVEAAAL